MGRGPKPAKSKVGAKRPVSPKSPKNDGDRVRDLEKQLAEAQGQLQARDRELAEALEQQTATSEILRVISSSPTDVQPVFEAIADCAMRLCETYDVHLNLVEGDHCRRVMHRGPIDTLLTGTLWPMRGFIGGRAVIERRTIHIADVMELDESEYPNALEAARRWGTRTALAIPLLREGSAIGVIVLRRREVRPFTDRQLALLHAFADQAVIAIENVRLFKELEGRNRDLTATGAILQVISSSPTDVQPVFDAIVESAARLCGAVYGAVVSFDGELMRLEATHNWTPEFDAAVRRSVPAPPTRTFSVGRAILERSVIHLPDVELDPEYIPEAIRVAGFRSVLAVPMLRDGVPLGAITVGRAEPGPFSDNQIALLQTFADQAVIAIENVRLFTELEARNRDLTATSEILRVIASSPTDVQPVFDAIAQSAMLLCDGSNSVVGRYDGAVLHLAAHAQQTIEAADALTRAFPMTPSRATASGRAVLEGAVVHIPDAQADPEYAQPFREALRARAVLAVPLLRDGQPIGTVAVGRLEARPFSDKHTALLQTFADQAVIAIENVRLFKELQEKNQALTQAHAQVSEALDQQTATAEILKVISGSPTDVQPVFDAIVISARRLLQGYSAGLTRVVGDQIELVALTSTDNSGDGALRARFPLSLQSDDPHSQAIRDRAAFHSSYFQIDPRMPEAWRAIGRARGWRSGVVVPMLRHEEALGTIAVTRREPGGFTDDEIALLRTFADQAVIAIENVRLFTELQQRTYELTRSVEKLTALGEISQAVSSTLDLETVLDTITERARQLAGADGGAIYEYDEVTQEFHLRATRNVDATLLQALRATPLRKGEGVMGRATETREPIQIGDIAAPGVYESHLRDVLIGAGYRALLAVPVVREGQIIGSLSLNRKAPGEFSAEVIDVLRTFATQSALAIQNARLFREIADKSRQLEVASQHKSEFLANMSHELRTPLNAIIGFSEVLSERMFGELNEKQEEYLKDIYASGQHLLSLINDILDLSKIEAGRMELELSDFHLPTAIENALMLVRERAGRRSIALHTNVDKRLGQIQADERKVRQVVLNLLSNAIKFTPEGGRIEVGAAPKDGVVEVSISDTGVGIAPEDQEAVFEEFRQVGTADKKVEGTGLGLTLCRKFVELHGGRIWVKSQLGAGSTFTFTVPVHHGE